MKREPRALGSAALQQTQHRAIDLKSVSSAEWHLVAQTYAREYPRPDHVLLHISDTHLNGGDGSHTRFNMAESRHR